MVDAIPALTTDKAVKLFEKFGVFTKAELESRAEDRVRDIMQRTINIEAKTMIDIAGKQIIPAVIKYTTELGTFDQRDQGCLRCRCQRTDRYFWQRYPDLLAETQDSTCQV